MSEQELTNAEQKVAHWDKYFSKISHLASYCTIELRGIDDSSIYYHPKFILEPGVYITSQCDIASNYGQFIYALVFHNDEEQINVEIYADLLDSVIVGYFTNKSVVLLALSTLCNIKDHIRQVDNYVSEYIQNLLIGNSVEDLTQVFINELKSVNKMVAFLKTQSKTPS